MATTSAQAGLEIDEDIQQQRKVWRIEKVSWCVMVLLMIAALSGLLGHGPLSSATLGDSASGMLVQYEHFERANAPASFRIQLASQDQTTNARISLGNEFFSKVAVSRIEPAPAEVEVWPDHLTYVFLRPEPGSAADIIVHYKPLDFGSVEVELGLEGYPKQAFSQFVYP